jgi:hypothetical protein
VKRYMANMLTCIPTTLPITISKISGNVLDTFSTLTFFSWHRTGQCTKNCPRKQDSRKTTNRTFIAQVVHNSHSYFINSYIKNLHTYLLSFTKRTQPLVDVETGQQDAEAEFYRQWEAGEVADWEESSGKTQAVSNGTTGGIWCSACKYFRYKVLFNQLISTILRSKELLQANCL